MAAPKARLRDIIVKIDQHSLPSFQRDKTKIGIGLIGFPFDEGTIRNGLSRTHTHTTSTLYMPGGRPGGRRGPCVFRQHVYKIGCVPNPEWNHKIADRVVIYDFGDVDACLDYDAAHAALTDVVQQCLSRALLPFVVGGSNDESFANFAGLARFLKERRQLDDNLGVINIDAHLDVRGSKRGLEHSGSPFRMMLESDAYRQHNGRLAEFAAQGHQCSESHVAFVAAQRNTRVLWLDKRLRAKERAHGVSVAQQFAECMKDMSGARGRKLFVSFDVDSIRQSDCGGVSCPSPIGLTASEAGDICFRAGRNENVLLMDMSEFNPDAEEYLTGKLLSWMFYNFVMGVSLRKSGAARARL